MRIVIDLQACQSESRFRGIGRYSMSLTKAIIRNSNHHEIFIALSDRFPETISSIRNDFEGLVPRDHLVTFALPGEVAEQNSANAWRRRTSELVREYFMEGLKPDIVHVSSLFEGWDQDVISSIGSNNYDIPISVTLYDLIPLMNQETYLSNQEIRKYYFNKIQSLKNANLLLAISNYTRQEAISNLGLKADNVINISSAVDSRFQPRNISQQERQNLLDRYNISKPFILCSPGGFDERKNITGLLTAFRSLPEKIQQKYQLIITGKIHYDPCARIINHAKGLGLEEGELILTDYVEDNELITLYNLCDLFVLPSLFEGFGLPVLEAISCGAIAIASDTTSLPEIISRKDALFDPTNPDEIAAVMNKALADEGFRQDLREHEHEQSKKFSWDISGKTAITAFESLISTKPKANSRKLLNNKSSYQKLISSIGRIDTNKKPTNLDLIRTANCIAINSSSLQNRQILVDISVLVHGDAKSGIQRVVRSVLLELLKAPPIGYTINPIYFDDHCYRYAKNFINDFLELEHTSVIDDVVNISCCDIYLGLDLSAHLTEAIHNYLVRLNALGIKIYFIVYDILLAHHPEWWPEGTSKIFTRWLKSITEVATGLVCISRSVAVEVRDWVNAHPPERAEQLPVGFFHLGADIENSAPTVGLPENADEILNAMNLKPGFLMVGTIEPRKGHAQVISSFESLWNQGTYINLVIVGKRGWMVEQLVDRISSHPMLGKHLFWLEGISDEFLVKIYNNSKAVIMASEGEGFGLPIIEAASHNTPLILRDLPVFKEIAGDNATYFSGLEPESLASVIVQWLDQDRLGVVPSSDKIEFLSWGQSVSQLMDVIINQQWLLTRKRD
ncbi:MAG: glycosyltransferase family 1 protein [Bellilinea sp.]